jgi:N-acyl-D-aspartate/D-glutamate deacylase
MRMEELLEDALDAGFLGLSTMTNPWDKIGGDRYRSRSLPSTYATWGEYRRLNRVLRRRGRVLQSAPNLTSPLNAFLFLFASMGALVRRSLKTSLLTASDSKAGPLLVHLGLAAARLTNVVGRGDVRWQHVPTPFEVYADGIDLVVFEELGAGRAALHLQDEVERNALLRDESYRRSFRRAYEQKWTPRVWNRNFHEAFIVGCPDRSVVGKSFGQVADERGVHPVDAYLDLVVAHGSRLRWRMTIANHRPEVLASLASHPDVQMGFADSGAHLRNMAFYSFPVRFLRRVHDAERAGRPFLSLERAVQRVTGELAAWFGVDAGTLREGDRADLVVVDPAGLDASLEAYHEAPIPEFGGLSRMVDNSDAAVAATLIGGRVVCRHGDFVPGYGRDFRTGRFLRAGEPRGTTAGRREEERRPPGVAA